MKETLLQDYLEKTSKTSLFSVLFMFVIVNLIHGQTPMQSDFTPYGNSTYRKNVLQSITYSSDITAKIGYELYSGNYYYLYRKALNFQFGGTIAPNSTIQSAALVFSSGVPCGSNNGSIVITDIRYDYFNIGNDQAIFNAIKDGTKLDSISISGSQEYSINLSAEQNQEIQNVIQTAYPLIGLGVFNRGELYTLGTSFTNVRLRVAWTIPQPPAPTNLRVTNLTGSTISVEWNPSTGNADGYKVYKNGNYYTTTTSTNATISGLCPNSNTTIYVKSYNVYGEGPQSSPISETTSSSQLSGPTSVCSSGANFSVLNMPADGIVTWGWGPYITKVSADGSNPCTFASSSNGQSYIDVTINSSACGVTTLPRQWVNSGEATLLWVVDETGQSGYAGNSYSFSIWPYNPSWTYYCYTDPYADVWYLEEAYAMIYFEQAGSYEIYAYATNECGTGNTVSYGPFNIYSDGFLVSPNPATNEVTITIGDESSLLSSSYDVTIIDSYGALKKHKKFYQNKFSIPINDLKNGTYFIRISNGKTAETEKIIVKH